MDIDVAFCLGEFIAEQVQLIDEKIDEIRQEERDKFKGNAQEERCLVEQFIDDLRAAADVRPIRNVLNDPTRVEALRAEILTKVGTCVTYVTRLRGLATPLPNTKAFVTLCTDTINYCRNTKAFDENFQAYNQLLMETEDGDLLSNTQKWWKKAYGGRVAEVNERNKRFNPALTDTGFVTIAENSRIMDNGRLLLSTRKVDVVASPKEGIVRRFVRSLLTLDENRRKSVNEEQLVAELDKMSVNDAARYARTWLKQRDDIRTRKENDPCKFLHNNFFRRRLLV